MYGPTGKNAALTGMPHPDTKSHLQIADQSCTGAIVSVYNAGQALGTMITAYSADRFSRRWSICAAGIIGTGLPLL
jgi:MFS family permease